MWSGEGGGWGHPSGLFPGSEHVRSQSLPPQLTYFLPGPNFTLPPTHTHTPGTHTAGLRAELTTSTPSNLGLADSHSAVPTPPPGGLKGGGAGRVPNPEHRKVMAHWEHHRGETNASFTFQANENTPLTRKICIIVVR